MTASRRGVRTVPRHVQPNPSDALPGSPVEPLWTVADVAAYLQVFQRIIRYMRREIRQHRTRLNRWVLPLHEDVAVGQWGFEHWRQVVREVANQGRAYNTVTGAGSTMMALAEWARHSDEQWLPEDVPPAG